MEDNCIKTALQIQIEKIKERSCYEDDMIRSFETDVKLVFEKDAIQALEDLEVALTDCYKNNK